MTPYTETISDPNTVPPKKVTGEKDPYLLYIVVGAVGGAVLLAVVVVGVVCIRRRRKAAHQQNDMKEERNNKASPVYQNSTGNNTVDNDLYEGSRDVQPMNAAENQEDDFMLSDAYASVDMPVTNTCTPREEVPSGDVNLENLYAKPDKSKHTEVHHDIYAEVQKPKKKKQDDPMVSEDFSTGDVYAKPNKGLKAQQ
ncbi:uncharacterized protein [Haliotis cracherodii]|uniref:uncharacterized protein n=1 Tax=Haliotis cracherodii TaxID=6455 RepID=UPI0039ED7E8C